MIKYERNVLNNGLVVITHHDPSTSIAAVNLLYKVGARDEDPDKTGFAHLFEHLMFGGSVNIPVYDEPLEKAGGENNAFTNNDITNYYLTLPVQNLETAFWLESDRMFGLDFSERGLEIQKKVVSEEFRQRYLNQPYGDAWLMLRPLAYKVHPYRWPTIGKDISHITDSTLDDVKKFFTRFYNPSNAVLVVSGNILTQQVVELAEKWFGSMPGSEVLKPQYPAEPLQKEERRLSVCRNLPQNMIYKVWHMCSRTDNRFYAADLLSDILSSGNSSRLYEGLVKKQKIFTEINAYLTGEAAEGLFVVAGRVSNGISFDVADNAIMKQLDEICNTPPSYREIQKVKNRAESINSFSGISILGKAMSLAYSEFLGDVGLINKDIESYMAVTAEDIRNYAGEIFRPDGVSSLYYEKENGD